MTNAERIRKMTDVELAYFLVTTSCSICCDHPLNCGFDCASLYQIKAEKTEQEEKRMNEYGMNEFELIKKADVMRIINAENAVVLNNLKERSTDDVLCAIAAQINGLQTTTKSGSRLIDADAFTEKYGNYYAEEGTAEGFIGTVGELIAKQPTIEPEVRHGRWILSSDEQYEYCTCSVCGYQNGENWMIGSDIAYCANCGAKMDIPEPPEVTQDE